MQVGIVVDAQARLSLLRSHEATGVLGEAAFVGDAEGEEERVELWAVEALADVLAGRDDDERIGGDRGWRASSYSPLTLLSGGVAGGGWMSGR